MLFQLVPHIVPHLVPTQTSMTPSSEVGPPMIRIALFEHTSVVRIKLFKFTSMKSTRIFIQYCVIPSHLTPASLE